MSTRTKIVVVVAFVSIVAVFSACTAVVAHERETVVRSAEAGSTAARFLIAGSNFWSRYCLFFIIAGVSAGTFVRRILMEFDKW